MSKCYDCREDCEGLFCKKCEKSREDGTADTKGSSTLIIYNKI
jgi:hypothetical protein